MTTLLPHRPIAFTTIVLAAAILGTGCAPIFQDARLVPPGRVEITPSVSGAGVSDEGQSEYLVNTFAVQAQAGVHERLNLGVAYARFEPDDFDAGLNTMAFGPRIGLVRDRVALALPLSFAFGQDIEVSDTWQLHPTALFTVPIRDGIDFNPSARLLIPFCEECGASDILIGFTAGFGFRAVQRLTVRPEAGILLNPGESGVVWTFGVAVSIRDR